MSKCRRLAIHWFRRDLRLTDNSALHHTITSSEQVLPVYVISDWKGTHRWTGPARQQFLCGCLESLERNVAAAGGKLIFRRGNAAEELEKLIRETKADAVFTNRDPDPHGSAMEADVARRCRALGVTFETFKDTVLHEHTEVMTGSGTPYRVFTPYNKSWQALPKPPVLPAARALRTPSGIPSLPCPTLETWKLTAGVAGIPAPGERAARGRMKHVLASIIPDYSERRNIPHGQTTSRLSADLRHGTLSIRELCHHTVRLMTESRDAIVQKSCQTFLNELAWREFYMQILSHFPDGT